MSQKKNKQKNRSELLWNSSKFLIHVYDSFLDLSLGLNVQNIFANRKLVSWGQWLITILKIYISNLQQILATKKTGNITTCMLLVSIVEKSLYDCEGNDKD